MSALNALSKLSVADCHEKSFALITHASRVKDISDDWVSICSIATERFPGDAESQRYPVSP